MRAAASERPQSTGPARCNRDAGDRRLLLFRPPIFDGPTTRGLYDERTGVMCTVDSFAALTTGAVYEAPDLPSELYDETFTLSNSMISPRPSSPRPREPPPPPRGTTEVRLAEDGSATVFATDT